MPAHQLSTTFAALADPTRRAILARLLSGECSVTELAEPFDMSMPAVSKHLRVLERAGLIHRGREAQRRPRTLDAARIRDVAEWAGEFRRFWDARSSPGGRAAASGAGASARIPGSAKGSDRPVAIPGLARSRVEW